MIRHNLFYIVSIWFVLTQTFPPINILFPFNASIVFVIFDAITVLLFPKLLIKRSIFALCVFTLIAYLFHYSGNAFFDSLASVFVPFLTMLSGLLIAEYTLTYDKKYGFTIIIIGVAIISNIIMTFISIPQVWLMPNIIRPSVLEMEYGQVNYYWIIKYATCHGITFLFAPLMFLSRRSYRYNRWLSMFWILVSALLFYIVFLSNATMPLLLSVVMIILGLLFKNETFSKRTIRSFVLVGLLSISIFQPAIIKPLVQTAQRFMDTSSRNYTQMNDIVYAIVHGDADGDLGIRQDLYKTSSALFFESPLVGTQYPELISHHSWFLDRLACFGILLFIPVLLIFIYHIKPIYGSLRHTKVIYSVGLMGFLLMLFLKNEFGSGSWLFGFALLPILCRYIDYLIDNKFKKIL